jgi:cytochrome c oxidase subunit 2
MEPIDYQQWLSGETRSETPELAGQRLFEQLRCGTCHQGGGRGPALEGVFGSEVLLANGQTVVADEGYIRRSILDPQKEVVKGFEAIMPAYAGQLTEEDLIDLGAYIRSLSKK